MTSLTRCTAATGTCKWVLRGRAGGCHLTDTSACAAGGRASFCLVRPNLGLYPAQAAAGQAAVFIRTDSRSELACDGFRCGCCCTLLLYEALEPCDQIFELWSLNWGGAMGIRTPDLLHAIQWQHVHRSTSVQVTVSGRPHQSPGIQACCCTFVLTVPSFHRRKLSGPAPGRRTLDIAPDCICQPPEIAVANDLTLLRRARDTGPWRSARQVAGSRLILRM